MYVVVMVDFEGPRELKFNRGLIADPEAFARDANAASWLFLCGEEFAEVEGGMSYASVQAAVDESVNIPSDAPRELDMELAREHVAALDRLPRPTLVTCRTGPRSSAVVYLYAGLRAGAAAADVLKRAEADDAGDAGADQGQERRAQAAPKYDAEQQQTDDRPAQGQRRAKQAQGRVRVGLQPPDVVGKGHGNRGLRSDAVEAERRSLSLRIRGGGGRHDRGEYGGGHQQPHHARMLARLSTRQ